MGGLRTRRVWVAAAGVLVTAGALVAWWAASRGIDTSLRLYDAHRATSPVTIDGRLDDAAWLTADLAGPFVLSDGSGMPPLACTARLLWDDDALYVAFEADDKDLISPFLRHDDDLFTRDVAEVFLDPEGDGKNYYELEVSPRGVTFDALFPSYRKDLPRSRAWNAFAFDAAAVTRGTVDDGASDEGWTAELRIPWATISFAPRTPPAVGDLWRMNLFRIDVHADGSGHYAAWTPPLRGDFHALDRFGTLRFSE